MFLANAIGYSSIKFMKQFALLGKWINFNVTLLSLNNISEFKKKMKYFY